MRCARARSIPRGSRCSRPRRGGNASSGSALKLADQLRAEQLAERGAGSRSTEWSFRMRSRAGAADSAARRAGEPFPIRARPRRAGQTPVSRRPPARPPHRARDRLRFAYPPAAPRSGPDRRLSADLHEVLAAPVDFEAGAMERAQILRDKPAVLKRIGETVRSPGIDGHR